MTDYLSRHPSPSNQNNQVKAEELWNNWIKVNKIDYEKFVLDEQKRQEATNKPIREQMAKKRKVASESERENELCKQERQTIKGIIASIRNQASSVKMDSSSDSDMCDTSTIELVDKPPLETPICYSINQVEILQNLGNYNVCRTIRSGRLSTESNQLARKSGRHKNKPPSRTMARKNLNASVSNITTFFT